MKLLSRLGVFAAIAAFAFPAFAADLSGKWNATVDTDQGPIDIVFEFMADGDMLSGTMLAAAMQMPPLMIAEGMIDGADFTFKLPIEIPGGAGPNMVIEFAGSIDGDELDMTSKVPDPFGGDPMVTEFKAMRAK